MAELSNTHTVKRLLAGLVTIVASVVPLVMTGWSLGSVASVNVPKAAQQDGQAPVWDDNETKVRPLPLRTTGGRLEKVVGQEWSDTYARSVEIEKVERSLVNELGMGASWDSVKAAITAERSRLQAQEGDPTGATYPYSYSGVESQVAQALSAEAITTSPDKVVELSSALMFQEDAIGSYVVLRRSLAIRPTCDAQLNLAFSLSLATYPDRKAVDKEFRRAAELCSTDATPLMALGRFLIADSRQWDIDSGWKLPDAHIETSAVAVFQEVQTRFPRSSVGYIGEAAAVLDVAEFLEIQGVRRFQARSLFHRVQRVADQVLAQREDPEVLVLKARAQAGLGEFAEAVGTMKNALQKGAKSQDAAMLLQRYLYANRDFEGALNATPESEYQSKQCERLEPWVSFGDRRSVAFWPRGCAQALVDAGGALPGIGGEVGQYVDFIPRSREIDTNDNAIMKFVPRWQLLVLLDRADEVPDEENTDIVVTVEKGDSRAILRQTSSIREAELIYERYQDIFRAAGDFAGAERRIQSWLNNEIPDSPRLLDRLGEVQFLQGKYEEANESFEKAAIAFNDNPGESTGWFYNSSYASKEWSTIKRATALYRLGKLDTAELVLRQPTQSSDERTRLSAYSLRGLIRTELHRWDDAVTDLQEAVAIAERNKNEFINLRHGVDDNNLSVAAFSAGKLQVALDAAQAAVNADDSNPLFLENYALAAESLNRPDEAATAYRKAIDADPGLFSSRTNLGVLLYKQDQRDAARQTLLDAVAHKPDYALGWWNLGIARIKQGSISDWVMGQGLLGMAVSLDHELRGQSLEFIKDTNVYTNSLDLAKPLPPRWSTSGAAQSTLPPFTLSVLAIVLLRGLFAIAGDQVFGQLSERFLSGKRLRRWTEFRVPLAAVLLISTLIATWLIADTAAGSFAGVVMVGVPLLLVLLGYMAIRQLVEDCRHEGNFPGSLLGVGLALVGQSFIPMPVIRGDVVSSRARWLAPIYLATASAVLIAVSMATGLPFARSLGLMGVAMVASVLIPVEPFDGAYAPNDWRATLATAGLLAVTVLEGWSLL